MPSFLLPGRCPRIEYWHPEHPEHPIQMLGVGQYGKLCADFSPWNHWWDSFILSQQGYSCPKVPEVSKIFIASHLVSWEKVADLWTQWYCKTTKVRRHSCALSPLEFHNFSYTRRNFPPRAPALSVLDASFTFSYVCTCRRKFFLSFCLFLQRDRGTLSWGLFWATIVPSFWS